MDNATVAGILEEMGTLLEFQGANPFKSRAFHNAARTVRALTRELETLAGEGSLREVHGIGPGIAAVITDLLATGGSPDHEALRALFPTGLLDMLKIEGLGPKRIKTLFEELKITSIDELEQAARVDRLAPLKGFGAKTQEKILRGITSVRERGKKVLFPTAAGVARELTEFIRRQPGVSRAEIAGSVRRCLEIIGDIDIVAAVESSHALQLMTSFQQHPLIAGVRESAATITSAELRDGLLCCLHAVPPGEFPEALLRYTGSREHNHALKTYAQGKGLEAWGRERAPDGGEKPDPGQVRSEEDLYAMLGLPFIPPELREGKGEVEAAARDALPRLVELSDLKGTLHCHTTYSDGLHTLEQMAEAAAGLGWEFLGIADHSKAAAYAGGLTRTDLLRQFREIDALNERTGIRVLKGTECDILPDGSLDWPVSVLADFDYVVVSVHSGFKMTEQQMTARITRALRHKHVTMLGHPTGRLLLARDSYPLNMEQVIDVASDHGKMIEINAHPSRLDLDWRFCRYAKERGVLISINPDAHSTGELENVRYGVQTARKGWLEAADILNTRPTRELLALLAGGSPLSR